jgi:hypothetical protein
MKEIIMPTEVFVRTIDEQVGDLLVIGRLQVETPPYDGSGKFRDMELGKRRADVLVNASRSFRPAPASTESHPDRHGLPHFAAPTETERGSAAEVTAVDNVGVVSV